MEKNNQKTKIEDLSFDDLQEVFSFLPLEEIIKQEKVSPIFKQASKGLRTRKSEPERYYKLDMNNKNKKKIIKILKENPCINAIGEIYDFALFEKIIQENPDLKNKIKFLSFKSKSINIPKIGGFKNLEKIFFLWADNSFENQESFKLEKLKELRITKSKNLKDAGFKNLSNKFPNLEIIGFFDTNISLESKDLPEFKHLKEFLFVPPRINNKDIDFGNFLQIHKNIKRLYLHLKNKNFQAKLKDNDLLENLEEFHLGFAKIKFLELTNFLNKTPNIKKLMLEFSDFSFEPESSPYENCKALKDLKNLDKIEELSLKWCTNISEEQLGIILTKCKNVKKINLEQESFNFKCKLRDLPDEFRKVLYGEKIKVLRKELKIAQVNNVGINL